MESVIFLIFKLIFIFSLYFAFSFVASWIATRDSQAERTILSFLFDKYVPQLLEVSRLRFKKITPIPEIALLQMTCHLLNCLLVPKNVPNDCPKEWYVMIISS